VKYLCLLVIVMTTVSLMAAGPVGRVTSSGPLTLNGKALPTTAVSSLPVVAGDEIATSNSPAMIYFTDKSRATLEPNTRVKLESRSSSVALHVLSGSADLQQAEGSQVSLIQIVNPVEPNAASAQAAGHPGGVQYHSVKKPCPPPPPPPPPRSSCCPPSNPKCK
jgi:hypothetical protein